MCPNVLHTEDPVRIFALKGDSVKQSETSSIVILEYSETCLFSNVRFILLLILGPNILLGYAQSGHERSSFPGSTIRFSYLSVLPNVFHMFGRPHDATIYRVGTC